MRDTTDLPRYWAFISYSRHDSGFAQRLVKELARAKVPRSLRRGVVGAASTFVPLFRDKQDASARSALLDELRDALDASRKLIVVCSPYAVDSGYVEQEIRHFQARGRGADILCIVASGEPNAADAGHPRLECFPLPLRETVNDAGETVPMPVADRPLAVTLDDETHGDWTLAIAKLRAGLLDSSPAALKEMEQHRWRRRVAFVTALLALIAAGIAFLAWAYWLPHASYSRAGINRWGVWEPIDSIPLEETRRRPESVRFVRDGAYGSVVEVSLVNQRGRCPISFVDPEVGSIRSITGNDFSLGCTAAVACGKRYEYGVDGRVDKETIVDQYGNTLETLTHKSDFAVLMEAAAGCGRTVSGIEVVELQRYETGINAGRDKRVRFKGGTDKQPLPNNALSYGVEYDYDAHGNLTETRWLGKDGRPSPNRNGTVIQRDVRDADAWVIERQLLDADGNFVRNYGGNSILRYTWDRGLRVKNANFDAIGQPSIDVYGVHATEFIRNDEGEIVERRWLDTAGALTTQGRGVASTQFGRDVNGYVATVSLRDVHGRPTMLLDRSLDDGAGKNCELNGCELIRMTRSDQGAILSSRCFTMSGQPALTFSRWHEQRTDYSPTGQILRFSYWDSDGRPTARSRNESVGSAVYAEAFTWDDNHRRTAVHYYGADGRLTHDENGTAGFAWEYDAKGNQSRERYVASDGSFFRSPVNGCHSATSEYDELNQRVRLSCRGADGQPHRFKNSNAAINDFAYADGLLVGVNFVKADGVTLDAPVAHAQFEHDAWGRETVRRYFNARGEPARKSGVSTSRSLYDQYGREIGTDRIDGDGNLLQLPRDCGAERFDLDDAGRKIGWRCIDSTGKLSLVNGMAHAEIRWTLDAQGNRTEWRHFGNTGEPVVDRRGAHGYSRDYDHRGRLQRDTARNAEWQIVATKDIWAICEYVYDALDRKVEERLLDVDGKPLEHGWIAYGVFDFDDRGRTTRMRYLDHRRKPMLSPASGRAEVRYAFDDLGRISAETSHDVAGKPIDAKNGWHRKEYRREFAGGEEKTVPVCMRVSGRTVPCEKG